MKARLEQPNTTIKTKKKKKLPIAAAVLAVATAAWVVWTVGFWSQVHQDGGLLVLTAAAMVQFDHQFFGDFWNETTSSEEEEDSLGENDDDDDSVSNEESMNSSFSTQQHQQQPLLPADIQQELDQALRLEKEKCAPKQHGLGILLRAIGRNRDVKVQEYCDKLPTRAQVAKRYGSEPVVYGLETCQQFRDNVRATQQLRHHHVNASVRVAGLYQTGTNAFMQSLERNLQQDHTIWDHSAGIMTTDKQPGEWYHHYTVPWEKHVPPRYREKHWLEVDRHVDMNTILPVVLIRDPYHWMKSMCKFSYQAKWIKGPRNACPSLVLMGKAKKKRKNPVSVKWQGKFPVQYDSLVALWNEWNQEYLQADFPRLIIRYEDQLWHGEAVLKLISECAGVPQQAPPFTFLMGASKHHGKSGNLLDSMATLVDSHRRAFLRPVDLDFANEHLDANLMNLFHYPYVNESSTRSDRGREARNEKKTASKQQWKQRRRPRAKQHAPHQKTTTTTTTTGNNDLTPTTTTKGRDTTSSLFAQNQWKRAKPRRAGAQQTRARVHEKFLQFQEKRQRAAARRRRQQQ